MKTKRKIVSLFTTFLLTTTSATINGATTNHALACVAVANVREEPRHSAELGSQVTMGTPVEITADLGEWKQVTTPEGYKGYIISNSLQPVEEKEYDRWRTTDRLIVTAVDPTYIYDNDSTIDSRHRVSDLVNGCILEVITTTGRNGMTAVTTPDGRQGFVSTADTEALDSWAHQIFDAAAMPDIALPLMGVTYLWGGTSTKGMDCSGLTKIAAFAGGIILQRNASQQVNAGEKLFSTLGKRPTQRQIDSLKKGDLLFFGNHGSSRINHVGIYIGNGSFIHSSGRVKINSLNEQLPFALLHATRLTPENTKKLRASNSQFYFK